MTSRDDEDDVAEEDVVALILGFAWLHCNHHADWDHVFAPHQCGKTGAYRERHLGIDGKKVRLQLFLSVRARAQLGRLAHRKGYTVTGVVEELAAQAEARVTAKLSGAALTRYYDKK